MTQTVALSVLLIEDDPDIRRQVTEYFTGSTIGEHIVELTVVDDFLGALDGLSYGRVDILILDIFKGDPGKGRDEGLTLLTALKGSSFVPVILHTALPERVLQLAGPFVKIVGKDQGLTELELALKSFTDAGVPEMVRALRLTVEGTLRDYMWGFVTEHWSEFDFVAGDRDRLRRLLAARLAAAILAGAKPSAELGSHPAEMYVFPPVSQLLQLGDVRELESGEILIVLWPSCDLVLRDGTCKVNRALCAGVSALEKCTEIVNWLENESAASTKLLKKLIANRRDGAQEGRFFFLPPAFSFAGGLVDLQDLEHIAVAELRRTRAIATLASPYAESLSQTFLRYLGRVGTPDLDQDLLLELLRRRSSLQGPL